MKYHHSVRKAEVRPVIVGEREIAHRDGALEASVRLTPQQVGDLQSRRRRGGGRGGTGNAPDRGKRRQQTVQRCVGAVHSSLNAAAGLVRDMCSAG